MPSFDLHEDALLPSMEALFDFIPLDIFGSTYSYTDEDGLTAGMNDTGSFVRLVFMLNSAPSQVAELPHPWASYAFYLDEHPVERPHTALHFQLVFSPAAGEPSFEVWAATVMRYLCACFHTPSIPAFDCHDIASVLLGPSNSQLSFNLVRGMDDGQLETSLAGVPKSTFLLAVLFAPPLWPPSNEDMTRLDAAVAVNKGGVLTSGGANHPYEERVLMLLGD